ncbi:hypothetical protein [Erythrobacter crassostreae]|uniref:Uncharacterized protein n=1 Tax=Erythrobacter crassostreae TaxID=2828328 RepID=A0A9X1F1R8_9SPHN|nr:hypothetical protein [Erythrobacter crassostrea]MBV7258721.1 hypothetical protein [Erythrobacter crassostrea]
MTRNTQALIWAAIIIAAALICVSYGLNNAASFGIVSGLSGAAWGSLQADSPCVRGCLQ